MIYICFGMPKSATSFAFQLASSIANQQTRQHVLQQTLPEPMRNRFLLDRIGEQVDQLLEFIPRDAHYVVKTHSPLDERLRGHIADGNVRGCISIRNPFDIAVSLMDAGKRERTLPSGKQRAYFTQIHNQRDAIDLLPHIMDNARTWLDSLFDQLVTIPFVQISEKPYGVVEQICQSMGIRADPNAIATPFLQDKTSILEFNIGRSNRWNTELDLSPNDSIVREMKRFTKQYGLD